MHFYGNFAGRRNNFKMVSVRYFFKLMFCAVCFGLFVRGSYLNTTSCDSQLFCVLVLFTIDQVQLRLCHLMTSIRVGHKVVRILFQLGHEL